MPDSKRLRVLITNIVMNGRSGTEIVTRDLAIGLLQDGHTPIIYSPELGEIARELKSTGIPVLRSIDQICQAPDVIHGHHIVQTGVAAARFPNTPAIFVCHDFIAWHDAPPRLPNIIRYVAVGDATSDRLMIEGGIPPSAVRTIGNGVNIQRFKPGKPPPDYPRNALIMVKDLHQIEPIVDACKAQGINFDLAGPAIGKILHNPESIVPSYDLIFASGLTAIESMACLRPVIVCDGRGLAGFVDTARYQCWRRQNFGLRTLKFPLTKQNVLAELARYSSTEAIAVGNRVRSEASLEPWIHRYVELYRECIREFNPAREISRSEAAALALHIQTWSGGGLSEHARERGLLHQEIATLQTGLLPLKFGERVLSTDVSRIALRGFHSREEWAVWSARPSCTAIFRCVACDFPLAIRIEYVPYLSPGQPNREIACLINGEHFGSWSDQGDIGKCRTRLINLPESPEELELVFLLFRTSGLVSPASENISADARPLGMALVALTLVRAEAKPAVNDRLMNKTYDDSLLSMTQDRMKAGAPEMSVVVMSYKLPATLVSAVRSLYEQNTRAQIVVVNSGGGGAENALADAGLDVQVIERMDRVLPGGARNIGIAATQGRFVAFLAADCIAEADWVRKRLQAHHAGAAAVASSLLCHQPCNSVALAGHLSLFFRRMPRIPPAMAQAYGASYDRGLFEKYGLFRDDMEGGEDTEFHHRLPISEKPVWCPGIRTVHIGPSSLTHYFADQFRRGKRAAEAWYAINRLERRVFALGVLRRIQLILVTSFKVVEPRERLVLAFALPLIVLGGVVYALGALRANTSISQLLPDK